MYLYMHSTYHLNSVLCYISFINYRLNSLEMLPGGQITLRSGIRISPGTMPLLLSGQMTGRASVSATCCAARQKIIAVQTHMVQRPENILTNQEKHLLDRSDERAWREMQKQRTRESQSGFSSFLVVVVVFLVSMLALLAVCSRFIEIRLYGEMAQKKTKKKYDKCLLCPLLFRLCQTICTIPNHMRRY